MSEATSYVICPYCSSIFPVQVDANARDVKAVPLEGDSQADLGHNASCPKCQNQLFVRYSLRHAF